MIDYTQHAALLALTEEAYPDRVGHYVHAVGRYVHAGVDHGKTQMVVVRHGSHAPEALEAALARLARGDAPEDIRGQLDALKRRLRALASSWPAPREGGVPFRTKPDGGGVAYAITPESCAQELLSALEEPL